MAYRLDASGSPPDEIRVAARDQLEVAMAGLRGAADRRDPGEEIHTARKSLRRFRATLRLIRPHLGGHDYPRAARPARALGRLLSSPRDADVMARMVRGLIDDMRARRRTRTRRRSPTRWRSGGGPSGRRSRPIHGSPRVPRIVGGGGGAGRWLGARRLDWRSLLDGVARSYRRAREASTAAQRAGSSEALHEARKRAKDLRYQLDLLRAVWEPMMAGQATVPTRSPSPSARSVTSKACGRSWRRATCIRGDRPRWPMSSTTGSRPSTNAWPWSRRSCTPRSRTRWRGGCAPTSPARRSARPEPPR